MQTANPVLDAMIHNQWIFPAAEIVHITCFAFSIGMIALTDFSLLGAGIPRKSAGKLVQTTGLWTLLGLVLVIFSGFLLFLSDPEHYLENVAFRFKVVCLAIAIVYNYTIHRKVALAANGSAGVAKLTGSVSLVLWVFVVFGGLFIAFAG